ncbi:MAG: hypothetical protein JKY50_22575 [Oleispira sp.]|nr:hypothetical protein [Oleispira sp.]
MIYKEAVIMEIGPIIVNTTVWEDDLYPPEMAFSWTECFPPPYSDNDVDVDITKDQAIELVALMKKHFNI